MKAKEQRARALDFAWRLCFKGHPRLTENRKQRLWDEIESFIVYCFELGATAGWEDNPKGHDYPCDLFPDHFEEYDVTGREFEREKENRFYSMAQAICRSAFDAVSGFPGGVFGYKIGDLKLMYEGRIPRWINNGWVRLKDSSPVNLNAMPDEEHIAI